MEIFKLSATEMAEKLRSKELSATEIAKASLAHIEAVEPQVDAYLTDVTEYNQKVEAYNIAAQAYDEAAKQKYLQDMADFAAAQQAHTDAVTKYNTDTTKQQADKEADAAFSTAKASYDQACAEYQAALADYEESLAEISLDSRNGFWQCPVFRRLCLLSPAQ